MSVFTPLTIDLKGLTESVSERHIHLGDSYFDALNADVRRGDVDADVTITKVSPRLFEVALSINGTVVVTCDRCLDDMQQAVDGEGKIVARLGDTPDGDSDIITVDESTGTLDLTWFTYETIALAIPLRHTHDDPTQCNVAMMELLERHSAQHGNSQEASAGDTDPRWSGLEKIRETLLKE